MSSIRKVETPNPATPSASFPLIPLVKPASGNLTLTATITRDPGDSSPVLVQVKDVSGEVLKSKSIISPPGSQNISIPLESDLIAACEAVLTIEALPKVQTTCCTNPLPSKLTFEIVDVYCALTGNPYEPLLGKTVEMIHDGSHWKGSISDGCSQYEMTADCSQTLGGASFSISISASIGDGVQDGPLLASSSCSPVIIDSPPSGIFVNIQFADSGAWEFLSEECRSCYDLSGSSDLSILFRIVE